MPLSRSSILQWEVGFFSSVLKRKYSWNFCKVQSQSLAQQFSPQRGFHSCSLYSHGFRCRSCCPKSLGICAWLSLSTEQNWSQIVQICVKVRRKASVPFAVFSEESFKSKQLIRVTESLVNIHHGTTDWSLLQWVLFRRCDSSKQSQSGLYLARATQSSGTAALLPSVFAEPAAKRLRIPLFVARAADQGSAKVKDCTEEMNEKYLEQEYDCTGKFPIAAKWVQMSIFNHRVQVSREDQGVSKFFSSPSSKCVANLLSSPCICVSSRPVGESEVGGGWGRKKSPKRTKPSYE